MTLVSVVIPVYNHEDYVQQAANSVVEQDHESVELICIDDGSHDSSIGRILELARGAHRPIQVIPQKNAGAHAALNRGAELASGDLLMFLNSDDFFGRHRIHSFARTWERLGRPEKFWGFSGVGFVDETGAQAEPAELGLGHLSEYNSHVARGAWFPEMLAWKNVTLTSGNLVVSKALFHALGGFESYRMVHDWDMALKCLSVAPPLVIQQELYYYRVHGSNTFRSIEQAEGWRESALARHAHREMCRKNAVQRSVLDAITPAVEYLRMEYEMKGPLTY